MMVKSSPVLGYLFPDSPFLLIFCGFVVFFHFLFFRIVVRLIRFCFVRKREKSSAKGRERTEKHELL